MIEAIRSRGGPRPRAVAGDLITHARVQAVRDWFACSFQVTDEEGRPVMPVPFGDTITKEPAEAAQLAHAARELEERALVMQEQVTRTKD